MAELYYIIAMVVSSDKKPATAFENMVQVNN